MSNCIFFYKTERIIQSFHKICSKSRIVYTFWEYYNRVFVILKTQDYKDYKIRRKSFIMNLIVIYIYISGIPDILDILD